MDPVRQIRILIPPFFFLGAILLGAHYDKDNLVRTLLSNVQTTEALLGVLAAVAVFVIPVGFLIGGITRVFLTAFCWSLGKFLRDPVWFETWPPNRAEFVKRIWPFLDVDSSLSPTSTHLFYATVTFDHDVLYKHAPGMHEWLLRRWSGFSAASSSCGALLLAMVVSFIIGIHWTRWTWWLGHLSFVFVFASLVAAASRNWIETMRMVEFQSHRDFGKIRVAKRNCGNDNSENTMQSGE